MATSPTKRLQGKQALDARYLAIYAAIKRIPRGRVSSYGVIASLAGLPRCARLVGTALRSTPTTLKLPWHRVVMSSGRIAFPVASDHFREQCRRLQREGVTVSQQRVNMKQLGWPERNIDPNVDLDAWLWSPNRK
jgi:methylated-DNA-protein-cysteine methyltransferase related protein